MKKITFTLNFGLIGSSISIKEFKQKIFLEYLKNLVVNDCLNYDINNQQDITECLIIFNDIPIKIRIFDAENLNDIIYNHEKIKNLDVVILIFKLSDKNSINSFNKDTFIEFKDYFSFRNGISVLTGLNLEDGNISENSKVTHSQLIEKAKELDVLYGYEIRSNIEENTEFFNRILNDFIFKFQNSSPEIYDLAKLYGKELIKQL